jgi:AcrR family transcriptional regulator
MNSVKPTSKPRYRSGLRRAQAELTRDRIRAAAAALLEAGNTAESITFRSVAERAGVTEMTVYRHFPTRQALLTGLWEHLNAQMGPGIGMPRAAHELLGQHRALFEGFDRIPAQILASITTEQGREMRAALDEERRRAFLAIVGEAAPALGRAEKTRAAAVLQLLHSAWAWASLREQWDFSGKDSATATLWAIETLLRELRSRGASRGNRK